MAKDIRLQSEGRTVNEIVLDDAIRHAVFLERLKTHEVIKVVGYLNDEVFPDIEDKVRRSLRIIRNARDKETKIKERVRIHQLNVLRNELRSVLKIHNKKVKEDFQDNLFDIAGAEAEFQVKSLNKALPIGIDSVLPGAVVLKQVATNPEFRGQNLKRWFDDYSDSTLSKVMKEVSLGTIEGESINRMVSRLTGSEDEVIRGIFSERRQSAEAIVRTAVNEISKSAKEAVYKANPKLIPKIMYVATLDSRTTQDCARLDGQVFNVGEGPRPPQHIGCRSTISPVVASWKELGINLKEFPEGTRASINGQVPNKVKFYEFLKRESPADQNKHLGKTKADLWRSGRLKIDKFVQDGKQLTLKDLKAIEGLTDDEIKVRKTKSKRVKKQTAKLGRLDQQRLRRKQKLFKDAKKVKQKTK